MAAMDDLRRLLVAHACERLIYDYCRLVDFGEAGRIAELFTTDARWEGVELTLTGRGEIRDWFTRRQALTRRVSRHVCTNVSVDVLSDVEARSLCYMVNYRHDRRNGDAALPAPMEVPKFVGELRDRFSLTDDGWRFSERRVELSFVRRRGG
jgi:hypothetical protein